MRGVLNEDVQKAALKFIGREITLSELRLIPYVQYVLVNGEEIQRSRINDIEISIVEDWKREKFIGSQTLNGVVSKKFWNFMNEVIWISYLNIKKFS